MNEKRREESSPNAQTTFFAVVWARSRHRRLLPPLCSHYSLSKTKKRVSIKKERRKKLTKCPTTIKYLGSDYSATATVFAVVEHVGVSVDTFGGGIEGWSWLGLPYA